MGPFPTCKGPEGDKLQGTIIHHFFRIHFGTHYSKLKKFAPFGPKMGEGGFFQKSVSYTFENFYIPNFMPNFKKIVMITITITNFYFMSQFVPIRNKI